MDDAGSFRSLLRRMAGGTHRRFNVNGHRVYVACSSTGDRYVLIDGATRVGVDEPDFTERVTACLK